MNRHHGYVQQWAGARAFETIEIDCITCVMLKILDGKCKMSESGKAVMELLYDCVQGQAGSLLGEADHQLIARARVGDINDALRQQIYEHRLLAETMISRPVMKGFKAMLRAEGVIGGGI